VKVWQLTGRLIWHVLRWRGGDDVYLRLHGLSDAAEDEQARENWLLNDMSWTDNLDAYVVLGAEPEVES
jgi:hypothetical protein